VGRSTGDGGGNGGSVRRCERAKEEKAMSGRRGTNRNEVVTGDKEKGNPQAQECARRAGLLNGRCSSTAL
jgi:hypothetical protein